MSEDDNLQPIFFKTNPASKGSCMKIWKTLMHRHLWGMKPQKRITQQNFWVLYFLQDPFTQKRWLLFLWSIWKKVSATRNHYSSTSIVCFSGRRLLFLLSINIVCCVKTSSWHHCSSEGLCVINLQHLVVHANLNECCLCACNNQSNFSVDFRI